MGDFGHLLHKELILRWWLWMIFVGVIAGWATADDGQETRDSQAAVEEYEGAGVEGAGVADACAVSEEDLTAVDAVELEAKKGRYKLALLVMLLGIAGLFLMFFLITLLRMSRFHRRRLGLGAKREKTQYIDAWSKYRIKKDLLDDDKGGDDD